MATLPLSGGKTLLQDTVTYKIISSAVLQVTPGHGVFIYDNQQNQQAAEFVNK